MLQMWCDAHHLSWARKRRYGDINRPVLECGDGFTPILILTTKSQAEAPDPHQGK
jgi:hypothetical protein